VATGLDQAETLELRESSLEEAAAAYRAMLPAIAPAWSGWLHLRLARVLRQSGNTAGASLALRQAAQLPDSPGLLPSRLAARFEICRHLSMAGDDTALRDEAARLYRDLNAGQWLIERSSYLYYEEQLRRWAADRIPSDVIASEQHRQSMAVLLEKALNGESGWLNAGPISAAVIKASQDREIAVIVPEKTWNQWIDSAASAMPQDIVLRSGSDLPAMLLWSSVLKLPAPGPDLSLWTEPRDPAALQQENASRRRLLLGILFLVAGVLVFGSFATVRLVQRELHVAQLQSDFVATVSHEFRSPLTGIRQLAEMLLAGRAAHDEGRRRQYYELICQESDRLTRLVENVLDFSRIEHGRKQYRFEPIETAKWLRDLASAMGQRRPIETEFAVDLPAFQGDRESLSSAVLNLLDNAIKYSPEPSPVRLRANARDGWLTIAVHDKGFGIPAEDQRRIFDRFYRAPNVAGGHAKGAGLGLALVKRIADAHGGRVHVESRVGQGSTFSLILKVTP
jgi:signal transduction histidine kinase